MNYDLVVGLEVHIHLKLQSKMFCRCSADFYGKDPNTSVCPVCLGMPGALPVPNILAIKYTQMLGLALGGSLNKHSKFDRKNYFYPDLPKGYQITQYDQPLVVGGLVKVEDKSIRLRRIHLEEDTGKSLHSGRETLLDFNKSSVALVELVTEPDLHSVDDAVKFCQRIQETARDLGISDADMEKGQMRLEANISLRPQGSTELPKYRVEAKNINSFRFLEKAISFEIKRQAEILDSGKVPDQENRGWDDVKQVTLSQRGKEEEHDYRYFPEPDIPEMVFEESYFQELKQSVALVELTEARVMRLVKDFGITESSARIICESKELAGKFEEAAKSADPKKLANVLVNRKESRGLALADLVKLVTADAGEKLDEAELKKIIMTVLKENQKAVDDVKKGKQESIKFLVGQVMRKSAGKADPVSSQRLFEEILNGTSI